MEHESCSARLRQEYETPLSRQGEAKWWAKKYLNRSERSVHGLLYSADPFPKRCYPKKEKKERKNKKKKKTATHPLWADLIAFHNLPIVMPEYRD